LSEKTPDKKPNFQIKENRSTIYAAEPIPKVKIEMKNNSYDKK
jgi:hypothetical protein